MNDELYKTLIEHSEFLLGLLSPEPKPAEAQQDKDSSLAGGEKVGGDEVAKKSTSLSFSFERKDIQDNYLLFLSQKRTEGATNSG